MGKYWDWYEVEFERVGKKLNPERRTEILDSLREHVSDATSEFVLKGWTGDEAERISIKNLGSPTDIVRAELDTPKRQWLPVWVASLGLGWCALCLIIGSQWTMSMVLPALWLAPIGVLVATFYSRRAKLWALGGTVSTIGAVTLFTLCFTWLDLNAGGGMGITPMWRISDASQESNEYLLLDTAKAKRIAEIKSAFQTNDMSLAKALSYRAGRGWSAPTGFWSGYDMVEFTYLPSFEEARLAWSDRSPRILNELSNRIKSHKRYQAALIDPRSYNPRLMFVKNLPSFVGVSTATFCILALCHILALGLLRIHGDIARRRWRLAVNS